MTLVRQETSGSNASPASCGHGLRLSLPCPRCHEVGIIEWKSLQSSFRCHHCDCQFLIGKNGKVLNQADLPQVRFACPRCHQTGTLPAMLAVRGVECLGCRLPLAAGPDRQLHGMQEAADLRRQAHRREQAGNQQRLRGSIFDRDGSIRMGRAAGWLAAMLAVVVAAVMAWSLLGDSPERAARQFTYSCLAGDWNEAEALMAADDVQLAEFRRWRTRHFSSIQDKYRPAGDRVAIDVDAALASETERVFQLALTSDFIGTRRLEQVWRLEDELWHFDAVATLARDDEIAADQAP